MRRSVRSEVADLFVSILEGAAGTQAPFPDYADNPIGFIREVLGVRYLTPEQETICESVVHRPATNVQAAAGVGKSFLLACLALWWVFARGGLCFTTAPRLAQVKDILWMEVADLYDANAWKLGGSRTILTVTLSPKARAWGFTATQYSEESYGGRHAKDLLAIIDEASGITQTVDDGVVACLAYHKNRVVRSGNPLTPGTPFESACIRRGTIQIDVFSHPNVSWAYDRETGELLPKVAKAIMEPDDLGRLQPKPRSEWPERCQRDDPIAGAVSIEWIEDLRLSRQRGPGTAYWEARIWGRFPTEAAGALVPRKWFDTARARYDENPQYWDDRAKAHAFVHGMDVGDGVDPHALVGRKGPVIYYAELHPTYGDRQDNTRAIGLMVGKLKEHPGSWGRVDRVGVGSGVLSSLLTNEYPVEGVGWGRDDVVDGAMFLNQRAELFWQIRLAFEHGDWVIAPLPPDVEAELREELATIRYLYTAEGKVKIEAKETIRKRLRGRSTDVADALACTVEVSGAPVEEVEEIVEPEELGVFRV